MREILTLCSLCRNQNIFTVKQALSDEDLRLKLVERSSKSISAIGDGLVIHFSLTDEVREIFLENIGEGALVNKVGGTEVKELLKNLILNKGVIVKSLAISCVIPSKSVYVLAELKTPDFGRVIIKVLFSDDLEQSHTYPNLYGRGDFLLKIISFSKKLWKCVYVD